MLLRFRRVIAAVSLLVTAFAGSIVFSAPAQADPVGCIFFLRARGYVINAFLLVACNEAPASVESCRVELILSSVLPGDALSACRIGAAF